MLKHLTKEDVFEVIELAEAYRGKDKPGFLHIPSSEADQLVKEILTGIPERKRLATKVESLRPSALLELQALMWLGRGDVAETFDGCLEYGKKNKSSGTVQYIVQTSGSLPEYLRRGLTKIGIIPPEEVAA
jgi:hypothetical protein